MLGSVNDFTEAVYACSVSRSILIASQSDVVDD